MKSKGERHLRDNSFLAAASGCRDPHGGNIRVAFEGGNHCVSRLQCILGHSRKNPARAWLRVVLTVLSAAFPCRAPGAYLRGRSAARLFASGRVGAGQRDAFASSRRPVRCKISRDSARAGAL